MVKNVLARGLWKLMVDGEQVSQRLDKYPMTLEGEPLGWGTERNLEDFLVKDNVGKEAGEEEVQKAAGEPGSGDEEDEEETGDGA